MKNQIEETMFADIEDQNQRIQMLRDNCDEYKKETLSRKITEDEMTSVDHNLAEKTVELQKLEDELAELSKQYRDKMKPIKENILELAKAHETGNITEAGEYYYFKYMQEDIIACYDGNGNKVFQRRMKPEERQMGMKIE